ncbi:MAG: hypothetical protein MJ002_00090 [Paludibacteraceae bacterium]|nr:hypothetical protein [Paludibacteraceae bacterium]
MFGGCADGFLAFSLFCGAIVLCFALYAFFGPGIIVFFLAVSAIILMLRIVIEVIDDGHRNDEKEPSDETIARAQVIKENKKAIFYYILFLVLVLFVNYKVAVFRNRCLENAKVVAENARKAEYSPIAIAEIDLEYNRLDSIISNLPKPTKRNYEECYARVYNIKWRRVDTKGISELEDYQISKKKKILDILNDYIFKMQGIESKSISGGGSTMSKNDVITYIDPDGVMKTASISLKPNPKYMEIRTLSDL